MRALVIAPLFVCALITMACSGQTGGEGPDRGTSDTGGRPSADVERDPGAEASIDAEEDAPPERCSPGERACADTTTALACASEGGQWLVEPCADGLVCRDGACGEDEGCPPGAAFCLTRTERQVCAPDGSGYEAQACGDGQLCSEGQCEELACLPGERRCQGNDVAACAADGAGFEVIETCDPTAPCTGGACLDPCLGDGKTYLGCEFWAADLDHMEPGDEKQVAISVSNSSGGAVEVTVTGGDGAAVTTQTVADGALVSIPLPRQDVHHSSLSRNSYLVETTGPVTVHQFNPLNQSGVASNDASLLLPSHVVGTEYMVVNWPSVDTSRVPHGRAYVTIIAVDDATTVTVVPTVAIEGGNGVEAIGAGVETSHTLDRGQVLSLGTRELTGEDLTGTTISSSAPVVVFAGHECADIPLGTCCCDHIEQQLFPLEAWGTTYVAAKFEPRGTEVDIWRIVASLDDTQVTLTPPVGGLSTFTLQRGEVRQVESSTSFVVEATAPVAVAQFMVGSGGAGVRTEFSCFGGLGDPAFLLDVANSQFRSDYIVLTPSGFASNFLTFVYSTGTTVQLDGAPLQGSGETVSGTSWVVHRLPVQAGVHRVEASAPMGLYAHGYDCYVSYAYPGGLDL